MTVFEFLAVIARPEAQRRWPGHPDELAAALAVVRRLPADLVAGHVADLDATTEDSHSECWSSSDVAQWVGVSVTAVNSRAAQGGLTGSHKVGHQWHHTEDSAQAWKQEREQRQ